MTSRILVTGASGFVGRSLLRHAAQISDSNFWIGMDRSPLPLGSPLPDHFEFIQGDLTDLNSIPRLPPSDVPLIVVHLAGIAGQGHTPEQDSLLFASHVTSTWNLLSQLPAPCHFIQISTGLIYGRQEAPFHEDMDCTPEDSYALCKLLAEQALQRIAVRKNMSWAIIRPSLLYGPGQKGSMFIPSLCEALRAGQEFPMSAGEQLRDFLHIDDFSRALMSLIELRLSGIFNVAASAPKTLLQVAELAGRISGRFELIRPGQIPYRPNEVWKYSLSSSKLRQACQWQPEITLEKGLAELLTTNGNNP